MRDACYAAARSLTRFDAKTPSERLLADAGAVGMRGMARALNGLVGVIDPRDIGRVKGRARLHVADWMPAFVNAARVLVAVGAISMFWIVSAWPNGVTAITFCAVIVILLPLQGDVAYSASMTFLQGTAICAIAAALVLFGVLPKATTFPTVCLVLGMVLVPFGVLIALPWRYSFLFTAATFNFVPMLNITNGMNFDASQFWNGASAILVGIAVGTIAMLVIPPLSPAIRARRLLALTLADLRRLARQAEPGRQSDWESRGVARLLAMPDKAQPVERAELAAAVAVGKEIVRLRHVAPRFVPAVVVDAALSAFAQGRRGETVERLAGARPPARRPAPREVRRPYPSEPQGQHPRDFGSALPIRLLFRPADPMRFNEINLFGLYVAPITLILAVAWIIYVILRRVGDRFGLAEYVWHPALFEIALYVIIASSIIVMIARWGS